MMPSMLRGHRLALACLLALCALAAVFKIGYLGLTPNSDYDSYIGTAQLFAGTATTVYPQRVLKPLAPVLVTVAAPVLGFQNAFLFEVLLFYFAFALALYWLGFIFFEDSLLAFFVAILGALSYPILRYGVDLYTETGAQFFYVVSLALSLLYARMPSRKLLVANALIIGIGLLWKEYSVVSGLIFGLILLFESTPVARKLGNLALLALCSLLPTGLVQIWVYSAYHYTYLNWYVHGGASGFATQFTPYNLTKSVAALLGLAWLFVPAGLPITRTLAKPDKQFLLFAALAPCLAFCWGFVSSRLFYVMAPAFILIAVLGLARLPRSLQYPLVALVIAANLGWLAVSILI
jgi:hypothetical protein